MPRHNVYRATSSLHLAQRLERQVRRDQLLVDLAGIDRELLALATDRVALRSELAELREQLWPVVTWRKTRRPPAVDQAPLPPPTAGAVALWGRELRGTCLAIVRRHGQLELRDLHSLLHRYGFAVASAHPVKALADALGYEARCRRVRRVRRGVYEAVHAGWRPTPRDHGGSRDPSKHVVLPDEPVEWAAASSTAGFEVDPEERAEPAHWNPTAGIHWCLPLGAESPSNLCQACCNEVVVRRFADAMERLRRDE